MFTVRLGGELAVLDNDVFGQLRLTRPNVVQDVLSASRVALLGIERGARDVRSHRVTTTKLRVPHVAHSAPGVVSRGWLGERHITTVAIELAASKGIRNVFLNTDGTTSGVDEPRALLHLAYEVLVEEAIGAFVERGVDGHNVALRKHLLKRLDATAADLGLGGIVQLVVIMVQQLLAFERTQPTQNALANAANTNSTDNLAFEVV